MSEATVDSKGRIVIPEEIRRKLKMGDGTKVKITLEEDTDAKSGLVLIRKSMEPGKFIETTKGSIKKGSPVKVSDPLRLKEIWET